MAVIVQKMMFPFGKGHCSDQTSSLLRPSRRLIEHGKPTGRINYLFLELTEHYYVVGSLCHTPGNQLLFFPGLRNRRPVWQGRGSQIDFYGPVPDAFLDHITLESNRVRWHPRYLSPNGERMCFPPESNHPRRFATHIDGSFVFWFSMAIKGPKALEEVPQTLDMEFAVPDSDANRRIQDLIVAREDARFHLLQLNPANPHKSGNFLFFAFILDEERSGFEAGFWPCLVNIPLRPPFVRQSVFEDAAVASRSHPVEVPGFRPLVWVVVASIPGELTQDAIFGAYT